MKATQVQLDSVAGVKGIIPKMYALERLYTLNNWTQQSLQTFKNALVGIPGSVWGNGQEKDLDLKSLYNILQERYKSKKTSP